MSARRRRWPLHVALMLAPLLGWALWAVYLAIQRDAVDRVVVPADGVRWEEPGGALTVHVAHRSGRDTEIWDVTVTDAAGAERYRREFSVYYERGGAGFVRALQADDDPPLEIALFDRARPDRSVYLDPGPDGVREVAFARASPAAHALAERWLAYHEPNPSAVGTLVIANLWYWVLYWPVVLIARAIRSSARELRGVEGPEAE